MIKIIKLIIIISNIINIFDIINNFLLFYYNFFLIISIFINLWNFSQLNISYHHSFILKKI